MNRVVTELRKQYRVVETTDGHHVGHEPYYAWGGVFDDHQAALEYLEDTQDYYRRVGRTFGLQTRTISDWEDED